MNPIEKAYSKLKAFLRKIAERTVAGLLVDSDAKCNPIDSIGSSTKSRVSHSERWPSARFPGDKEPDLKLVDRPPRA
jgi:hypothetical protein